MILIVRIVIHCNHCIFFSNPLINIPALSIFENPTGPSINSRLLLPISITFSSKAFDTLLSSIKSNHPNLTFFLLRSFTSIQFINAAILPTISRLCMQENNELMRY